MQDSFDLPIEFRHKYVERRLVDLATLQAALRAGSLREFKEIGHQIRGNAVSFGYPELEKIGVLFEDVADANNLPGADDILAMFEAWCRRAKQKLG